MKGLWDDILWELKHIPRRVRYKVSSLKAEKDITPGTIYEDCRYHPLVCIENREGDLTGVSMVDGSISCCSYSHCGVIVLTLEQAEDRVRELREP